MKRFIAVLSGLLVLPAFAGTAPVHRNEVVEYNDEMIDEFESESDATDVASKQVVTQRTVAGRSVSRAISAGNGANNNSRTSTGTRVVASSQRNAQQTQRGTISRTAKTPTVSARSQSTAQSRATVTTRSATGATRTGATTKPVTARAAASGNVVVRGNATRLTDSGEPLYIPNTARVGTSRRSTTARNSTVGTASTPIITQENITETTSTLDALTELTDYCKAQYAQCMDNYCNVLDDNQGRCSCSGNISKYEKTEKSLAELSESFQDVVQKIKYIGLTSSQIEALFAETEAEITMKSKSDTSVLKNSLDTIKKKIVDVTSGKTNTGLLDGLSFDMSGLLDTDFSSTFDLNAFLGNNKVANQRGTSLFNTATQRCKTAVLNSCTAQGIDANVVINSYDLAIDKQCIEYERSLNEANEEMRNNVRNAQNILQQARLLLAQQKNSYDLRGCVAALDECMQDEYVCGDDYESCLDPTGKYLSHGEIVKGGTPGVAGGSSKNQESVSTLEDPSTDSNSINNWLSGGMYGLYSVWDYGTTNPKNAWGKGAKENLNEYISEKTLNWESSYKYTDANKDGEDIATYLLRRIGYIDAKNNKTYGMCANVLKQCQDYTYESKGSNKKYVVNNEVIRQYLSLALTKIKSQQDSILADYAETCWNDVYSCLSANNYDENNTNTTTSKTAVNACRGDVATCMSVTGYYPADNDTLTLAAMTDWVASKLISCDAGQYLRVNSSTSGTLLSNLECVACPTINVNGVDVTTTSDGGQATNCTCPENFARADVSEQNEPETWTIGSGNNAKYYTCKMTADACGYAILAIYNSDLDSVMMHNINEWTQHTNIASASLKGITIEGSEFAAIKLVKDGAQCKCPSTQYTFTSTNSPFTLSKTNISDTSVSTKTWLENIINHSDSNQLNKAIFCWFNPS